MKLFHKENEKEVVYVQLQDIVELTNRELCIPVSIYDKVFKGFLIVDDSNRFNFFRFDEDYEVNFFKEMDFIIDYDEYKDLNDEQLEEAWKKFAFKADEIAKTWNSMSEEEQEKNEDLERKHEDLEYIMCFISEIYAIKHNRRTMPFPDFVKLPKKESLFKKILKNFKRIVK